jgi:SAM-dependent methyltransferase
MTSVSYRQFTDSAAQSYQRHFVPTIATAASGDLMVEADLRAGDRVLDVACGTGLIARLAAERVGAGGAVSGVDIAPDMIEVARSVPAPAAPAIEWHVGDAGSLPFPDESYDVVLCQLGLMFMEDRAAAVREMHRVVATGGRVVVSTPGTIPDAFAIMEQAIVERINPDLGGFVRAVFSMNDPDAVGSLLSGAGLRDVSSREAGVVLRLPAPAEFLWQYIGLTPMAPIVAAAPEPDRVAMEQQVVERWQPYVVDGTLTLDLRMVVASGRR